MRCEIITDWEDSAERVRCEREALMGKLAASGFPEAQREAWVEREIPLLRPQRRALLKALIDTGYFNGFDLGDEALARSHFELVGHGQLWNDGWRDFFSGSYVSFGIDHLSRHLEFVRPWLAKHGIEADFDYCIERPNAGLVVRQGDALVFESDAATIKQHDYSKRIAPLFVGLVNRRLAQLGCDARLHLCRENLDDAYLFWPQERRLIVESGLFEGDRQPLPVSELGFDFAGMGA